MCVYYIRLDLDAEHIKVHCKLGSQDISIVKHMLHYVYSSDTVLSIVPEVTITDTWVLTMPIVIS